MATVTITKHCVFCGLPSYVDVDEDRYLAYLAGKQNGMPAATHSIQVMLPELTAGQREVLISGSHEECFDKAFGSDE